MFPICTSLINTLTVNLISRFVYTLCLYEGSVQCNRVWNHWHCPYLFYRCHNTQYTLAKKNSLYCGFIIIYLASPIRNLKFIFSCSAYIVGIYYIIMYTVKYCHFKGSTPELSSSQKNDNPFPVEAK